MTHTGRFAGVFSPEQCPKPIYDEILFQSADWVATPTLGSILPNWLLIIPRLPVLNFAQWGHARGCDPSVVISEVTQRCSIDARTMLWFEHGAPASGSPIGCGVEQAHLHVLIDPPFSFEEFRAATTDSSSQLLWNAERLDRVYGRIDKSNSYLFAASRHQAFVARNVESVGSQFFRRIIARMVDAADSWDYKLHPHVANVEETVRRLRRELV